MTKGREAEARLKENMLGIFAYCKNPLNATKRRLKRLRTLLGTNLKGMLQHTFISEDLA